MRWMHSWENRAVGDAPAGGPTRRVNSESYWKMLRTPLSQTTQRLFREQALVRTPTCSQARFYATEVPWARPPYRPAPTEQPPAETFNSPSRPRQYYARPVPKRELPIVEVNPSPFLSNPRFVHCVKSSADDFDDGLHLPFGSADGLRWLSSGRLELLLGSRS